MIQAALFLGCILLSSVTAFPQKTQEGGLPAATETEPPSSETPPPTPSICQNLLSVVPSIAPQSEYLSLLALRVVLENTGCPAEAYAVLQLSASGGKDSTETPNQQHSQEERLGNTEVILRHLVPAPRGMKRVQRSVALPEVCTSQPGWTFHEMAQLMLETAERLPSTDLVREFKASAVNATQECTLESWERVNEVAMRLMRSPEIEAAEIPIEDQVYMFSQLTVFMNRVFVNLLWEYFWTYFG
ncbi:uncharacterized protein LOC127670466 [Apodemus sylvaticus]|uniref:uncharacterized protein LOC127670466 n=1 Tax=Apodemus sylvaticus TaxID=10129 RepID=UPI0022439A2A|nr:uncharacterized protein LOC127670466 [Apodemus sylvaticus]